MSRMSWFLLLFCALANHLRLLKSLECNLTAYPGYQSSFNEKGGPTKSEISFLGNLLDPVPLDLFLGEFYEKKVAVIRNRPAHFYRSLLSIARVEESVFADSSPVRSRDAYEDWDLVKRSKINGTIKTHKVNSSAIPAGVAVAFYRDKGYSVVINRAENRFPAVKYTTNMLGDALGCRVQANVYLTPGGSHQAFELHYDWMDALVVQVSGCKRWRVYRSESALFPLPDSTFSLNSTAYYGSGGLGYDEFDLPAGSLLYIPRGVAHEASTSCASDLDRRNQHQQEEGNGRKTPTTGSSKNAGSSEFLVEPSLHITFGIEVATHGTRESFLHHYIDAACNSGDNNSKNNATTSSDCAPHHLLVVDEEGGKQSEFAQEEDSDNSDSDDSDYSEDELLFSRRQKQQASSNTSTRTGDSSSTSSTSSSSTSTSSCFNFQANLQLLPSEHYADQEEVPVVELHICGLSWSDYMHLALHVLALHGASDDVYLNITDGGEVTSTEKRSRRKKGSTDVRTAESSITGALQQQGTTAASKAIAAELRRSVPLPTHSFMLFEKNAGSSSWSQRMIASLMTVLAASGTVPDTAASGTANTGAGTTVNAIAGDSDSATANVTDTATAAATVTVGGNSIRELIAEIDNNGNSDENGGGFLLGKALLLAFDMGVLFIQADDCTDTSFPRNITTDNMRESCPGSGAGRGGGGSATGAKSLYVARFLSSLSATVVVEVHHIFGPAPAALVPLFRVLADDNDDDDDDDDDDISASSLASSSSSSECSSKLSRTPPTGSMHTQDTTVVRSPDGEETVSQKWCSSTTGATTTTTVVNDSTSDGDSSNSTEDHASRYEQLRSILENAKNWRIYNTRSLPHRTYAHAQAPQQAVHAGTHHTTHIGVAKAATEVLTEHTRISATTGSSSSTIMETAMSAAAAASSDGAAPIVEQLELSLTKSLGDVLGRLGYFLSSSLHERSNCTNVCTEQQQQGTKQEEEYPPYLVMSKLFCDSMKLMAEDIKAHRTM